jgi:hypothetical protein
VREESGEQRVQLKLHGTMPGMRSKNGKHMLEFHMRVMVASWMFRAEGVMQDKAWGRLKGVRPGQLKADDEQAAPAAAEADAAAAAAAAAAADPIADAAFADYRNASFQQWYDVTEPDMACWTEAQATGACDNTIHFLNIKQIKKYTSTSKTTSWALSSTPTSPWSCPAGRMRCPCAPAYALAPYTLHLICIRWLRWRQQ